MHGVQSLEVEGIRRALETYAKRGVFRSFSESREGEFRFHWLWNAPFVMTVDERSGALVFPKLLPGMQPESELESDVKRFLAACSSPERLEHRRLDPRQLTVTYSNRGGKGTLRFRIKTTDYETATRQAVQLVNELFVSHLSTHHPSYLVEHFRVPED